MTTLSELMNMSDRRTLITGAAGHLGRVMADTLAQLGSNLILVDKPGSNLIELRDQLQVEWKIKVIVFFCDLEVQDQRTSLVEIIKSDAIGLNCLINNAAFTGDSELKGWVNPFELQAIDTWRRSIEVNLTSAFHLCQSFASELRASRTGSIINIGSIYGELGPDWSLYENTEMGNPAAYAASKGGLLQLTRWLSTTMAPNVRVNAISPGGIFRNQPDLFVNRYVAKTPLKRMATEDDFCGAIAYLATDMSRYVTGQNLCVDGGWGVW